MSTPIADLMNDDGFDGSSKKAKKWNFASFKIYLFVFVATLAVNYMAFDTIRRNLPAQATTFGDAPVKALLATLVFAVVKWAYESLLV